MAVLSKPAAEPKFGFSPIPVIDISDPESKQAIVKACEDFGFFKVINHGEQTVVCEFQVPAEVRSTTPPVPFRIAPGAQVVERVPGDYAPGQPYAELRCSHAP